MADGRELWVPSETEHEVKHRGATRTRLIEKVQQWHSSDGAQNYRRRFESAAREHQSVPGWVDYRES